MKTTTLLLLTALPVLAAAQTPEPAAPAPAAPKLTEAQVNNVLSQLEELEKQILSLRGNTLTTILAKLRAAMASDQAATSLYLECDRLVNSERKEGTKSEGREREKQMERNLERKGGGPGAGNDEGDFGLAVRFGLQYLILTIEAHEAKDEELKKMVPKLQEYIAAVVAAAPKLKGRAYNHLSGAVSGRSPIVQAFQLDRYLTREGWSSQPLNFGGMYNETIFPLAAEENKDSLPGLWDARINAEAAFRKENMPEPEFILWTQIEVPSLRWQRAKYLYASGPSPIIAMADMLKLIKDNPAHADAPAWVKELRLLVNEASPTAPSTNLEKPTGI